ncbi:MAG: lipid asymmetry maintenance protein MlaB [Cyclobacteriaceae bacterium]
MKANISVSPKRKSQKGNALRLQGDLTISNAAYIKDEMIKALDKYNITSLQVSEVENLDLSVLQLIYAFRRAARTGGNEIQLELSLPDEIDLLVRQSGLNQMFNLS